MKRALVGVVYEENIRKPCIAKGKTRETMDNFYDMRTRTATENVEESSKRLRRKQQRELGDSKSRLIRSGKCFCRVPQVVPFDDTSH